MRLLSAVALVEVFPDRLPPVNRESIPVQGGAARANFSHFFSFFATGFALAAGTFFTPSRLSSERYQLT